MLPILLPLQATALVFLDIIKGTASVVFKVIVPLTSNLETASIVDLPIPTLPNALAVNEIIELRFPPGINDMASV